MTQTCDRVPQTTRKVGKYDFDLQAEMCVKVVFMDSQNSQIL